MSTKTEPLAELLSLQEAARILGYTEKGLRKIVERSRARCNGARTRGATIKFFQAARGSAIRFRPEWIEEFIEEHTLDPSQAVTESQPRKQKSTGRKRPVIEPTSGLDPCYFD